MCNLPVAHDTDVKGLASHCVGCDDGDGVVVVVKEKNKTEELVQEEMGIG